MATSLKRTILILFLITLSAVFMAVPTKAVSETGVLTVNFIYQDDIYKIPVNGAEISVYQVASYGTEGGAVSSWKNTTSFKDLDLSFFGEGLDEVRSEDAEKGAREAVDLINRYKIAPTKTLTVKNGKAIFSDLPIGLYLVRQTGSTGAACGFNDLTPHLVNVPIFNNDTQEWEFNVTTSPKATVKKPEIKTRATNSSRSSHTIESSHNAKIIDTVTYKNLIPGESYYLEGTLMNKRTKYKVSQSGAKTIKKFTPKESSGEIEVTFTLDTTSLEGEDLVVFEVLKYKGNKDTIVASHEDINDRLQMVHVEKTKRNVQTGDETRTLALILILIGLIGIVYAANRKGVEND